MAAIAHQPDPLERLPVLVDHVLIQIGKVFREGSSRDHKLSANTKREVRQEVRKANGEFHDALDEIEIEILKAKSVMERDLKALQAKRAERERAAGLGRLRESSREPPSTKDLLSAGPAVGGPNMADKEHAIAPESTPPRDVVMIEDLPSTDRAGHLQDVAAMSVEHHSIDLSDENLSKPMENTASLGDEAELKDPRQPIDLASTEYVEDNTRDHIILQEVSIDAPTSDAPLDTPTTANLRDANFESMFNDTELAGSHDAIDFDLDFSNEANIDQDLLNDNPFGEMTSNSNDFSNLNTTSNEDINTLLPGLENYVTASDDFSMLNMPPTASGFNHNAAKVTDNPSAAKVNSNMESIMGSAPIESSFDDMFFGSGDLEMGGTDDNDMGGDENMGNFGDFDDLWFKSDAT
ncbi:MAG: hypothetical protein Q9187_001045 [Circinaria calcarea]